MGGQEEGGLFVKSYFVLKEYCTGPAERRKMVKYPDILI